MNYQWQRFLYWAAQNSAAVQAVVAILMCFATFALAVITTWYAQLTHTLLNVNRRQLAGLFQPTLSFGVTSWVHKEADKTPCLVISGTITNVGEYPVKITNVYLERVGEAERMGIPANLILAPKQEYKTGHAYTSLPLPATVKDGQFVQDASIILDCLDLLGIAKHQFAFSPKDGLRHEFIEDSLSLRQRIKKWFARKEQRV